MDGQLREDEETVSNADTNAARVQRHLAGSIYIWACGQKEEDEEDDLVLSDRFIGWLILFFQALAYITLIVRASAGASEREDSAYALASVTGAMYLLFASTTHDLRAGFALLVDGYYTGHRVFGLSLLAVYGLMICAAMYVLMSESSDDAHLVLNAVMVLFVADLDEKALQFFSTVPQKWRLFWAIYSIGISFALAVVTVIYVGDSSKIFEDTKMFTLEYSPSWFFCAVNPAAVTLCCFYVTAALQALSKACSEACKNVDNVTTGFMVATVLGGLVGTAKKIKEFIAGERCFVVVTGLWLVHGFLGRYEAPGIFVPLSFAELPTTSSSTDTSTSSISEVEDSLEVTETTWALVISNAALAIGLLMKVLSSFEPRHAAPVVGSAQEHTSDSNVRQTCFGCSANSRVPSLLVGWGIGYWATSLLYVLAVSWRKGGWDGAPGVVEALGYVTILCFAVVGIFMIDTDVLGATVGMHIKPVVDALQNRRGVWYWIMATVLRDIVLLWLTCWYVLAQLLNNF